MDLLNGKIKTIYFKYFTAAFGSAFIMSIYGIVDMAMVGQYHGPDGSAAMAVIAPIWNIIFSLGLLTGIGGSVLFGAARGRGDDGNEHFTTALILTTVLSIISWVGIIVFEEQLLYFFGADEKVLLPLAKKYLITVKFVIPVFMFSQFLSAFLRNDNDPGRATKAVLAGGIFNVFGDYFCVFTLDMGITGAGLATAMGTTVSLIYMLFHFRKGKNTLKLKMPVNFWLNSKLVVTNGFSTFFADIAMGLLTIMFNRQIMEHLGPDALSVYGVIVNISTFVQCCGYSIGEGAQPIISMNFGAGKRKRIGETLKYAVLTAAVFGIIWTALMLLIPNTIVHIFMKPTTEVLNIAPKILGFYGLSFLLLPYNIFSTFYFQSVMKPALAFAVSVSRGLVVSGAMIYLLPAVFMPDAIWFSMLITEIVCALFVTYQIRKTSK